MKPHCHYGCYYLGCFGVDREEAIEFIHERYPLEQLDHLSDAEINERLVDFNDVDVHVPHIKASAT